MSRQRVDKEKVRDLVAKLYCAAGCSCCRDDDTWKEASETLALVLGVPAYEDGSGFDWYSVRDAAKEAGK
jgi:hypothetical protein